MAPVGIRYRSNTYQNIGCKFNKGCIIFFICKNNRLKLQYPCICRYQSYHRAMAIDPLLSPFIKVGCSCGYPNSPYKLRSQRASHAASARAIYSASVEDCAVMFCFLERHVITPPEAMKTYPNVDLQSSWFANAASA